MRTCTCVHVCVCVGVFVGVFVCGCGCQCSISVVNLSSMAAILKALTPLPRKSDLCILHLWRYRSINQRKYSTCTHDGGHWLQLALVALFLQP